MNLPNVVSALVKAQNNFDSLAYAKCFAETALVYDEGKTHRGRLEIQDWISQRNEQYKTSMKPIAYTKKGNIGLLSAAISGNFEGSPIVLTYHFELLDGLIRSLKITG